MESWDAAGTSDAAEDHDVAGNRKRFNVGLVGENEEFVFGSGCPGLIGAPKRIKEGEDVLGSARSQITKEMVKEWCLNVITKFKIKRALVLLSDSELELYKPISFLGELKDVGVFPITQVKSLQENGALGTILNAIKNAVQEKERILICCASGQVRTGTVASLWIHHQYSLELSAATESVEAFGRKLGIIRRPNQKDLLQILSPGAFPNYYSNALGTPRTSTSRMSLPMHLQGEMAWGTPRSALSSSSSSSAKSSARSSLPREVDILFITTGGTIDKDYPRSKGGYAFEIGEPAIVGILKDMKEINTCGFTSKIVSVCRKDSQDLTDSDRSKIAHECIQNSNVDKILITHGSDTMIDTAKYLANFENLISNGEQKIVLTGAMRPAKFANSDAAINIGVALGALWTLQEPGVYLSMNGKVLSASSSTVSRDEKTGLFYSKEEHSSG